MHVLALQQGVIGDGTNAVDLRQPPGDVIILSAADTDLACFAAAHDTWGKAAPSVRLANLLQLQHNMSVDLYVDRTLSKAKLVIVRLLGGRSYWPYGLDCICAKARENNIKLIVIPGEAGSDPALSALSSVDPEDVEYFRTAFAYGGSANASKILQLARHLIGTATRPAPAEELPLSGFHRKADRAGGAVVVFYRALLQSGFTGPVDGLASALEERGLGATSLFVQSLKDAGCAEFVRSVLRAAAPAVIVNATGFAVGSESGGQDQNPFAVTDCPVLQAVFSGSQKETWESNPQGLNPRDLSMNVVIPELDGRIMTRALSFKSQSRWHAGTQSHIVTYEPDEDRVAFTAQLAANWAKLRRTVPSERRVGIILANYPNRDGRIGNGVGYDTPESTSRILAFLRDAGYRVGDALPDSGNMLIDHLLHGPTNSRCEQRDAGERLALHLYEEQFRDLPAKLRSEVLERWGEPSSDPFVRENWFELPARRYGNIVVGIQPARGYNIDPKASYHDPGLVPPHGYFAFYFWLRHVFGAHVLVHNGKHGNLEWLPGKAVALGPSCYPEAAFGPTPQLYPFIVNDPGEGTQAKRRTSAVIIDHLTPPMTRAESYGPLQEVEALMDEYYLASGMDPRRLSHLRARIFDAARSSRLDVDAGLDEGESDESLRKLDAYLCDLKEAQIRNGLHVLGQSPQGSLEASHIAAMVRLPRKMGEGRDQSILRALAHDLGLGFDPLGSEPASPWTGPFPQELEDMGESAWRTMGDTVERLEALSLALIEGSRACLPEWQQTGAVLDEVAVRIRPALSGSGGKEIDSLLRGIEGKFVEPGPSGAPTRGRLEVLPTGRNFYSLDNRAVPTPAAWTLGDRSARALLARHFQDHGYHLRAIGLSAWGTSNMRTGGDDIAQAMALIGVRPRWEPSTWRLTGYDILPLAELGRPRVDVTLRISGLFRDAFPLQVELFDRAVRSVGLLEECETDNPIAERMRSEAAELRASGVDEAEADNLAGQRIFGSKPGTYGAGLQALIDEKLWTERSDLARAYIAWGSFAYGTSTMGENSKKTLERRLSRIEAVVHNQDNREHDLLDSDDYYQFEGGMSAAVELASGRKPAVYHNDHSRPERPVIRTLEEEIGRVMRSRVVNPKWIAGVMRHGYKGAFEIAATVDYLFAFAATTGAAKSHHFDLAYDAFIADPKVRDFIMANNSHAMREIADRLRDAADHGFWTPRSNSAYSELSLLMEPKSND